MKKLLLLLTIAILTSCGTNSTDTVKTPIKKSTYEHNGRIYRYAPPIFRNIDHCNTGRPILWDDYKQMAYEYGYWKVEYSVGADGDSCIKSLLMFLPKGSKQEYGFDGYESIEGIELDKR